MDRFGTEEAGVSLRARDRARLIAWARAASPREACGLLVGRAQAIEHVERARNLAPGTEHFVLCPADWLRAEDRAREQGLGVIGVWHSHPRGSAEPSRADRAGAQESHLMLIVGMGGGALEVRAWWGGGTTQAPLSLLPQDPSATSAGQTMRNTEPLPTSD